MVLTIKRENLSASDQTMPDAPAAARRSALLALLVELRPQQWIKNLVCLAGLVFSGRLFLPEYIGRAAVAIVSFCLASACMYILNDYVDLERDRRSPRTAARPLAAGELPLWVAAAAFVILAALATAGSVYLGAACLTTFAAYCVINVAYSVRLKHTVIADVMCIALGFVLRLVYGIYAVEVKPTAWIVLCMFFLALFLGFAKRKAESVRCNGNGNGGAARPVLDKYTVQYLDVMLSMSATMTIACYALFTVASGKNAGLAITVVPVVYCVTRYMLQVMIHGRGESPEKVLMSDEMMWLGILTWLGLCVIILYSDLQIFSETTHWQDGGPW